MRNQFYVTAPYSKVCLFGYRINSAERRSEQRIQHAGDDQSADSLDQIGRYTGQRYRKSIEEALTQAVAERHESNIDDAAEEYYSARLDGFADAAAKQQASAQCDQSFDDKRNGHIDKISAQGICHGRSDAGGEESTGRIQKNTAEYDDSVAGVDIALCAGDGDPDGHGGHAGQSRKERGHDKFSGG